MASHRLHLDTRAEHNALMAQLCRQAAAGLAEQIILTKDPTKQEVLRRRMQEREAESERHRKAAEELTNRGVGSQGHASSRHC